MADRSEAISASVGERSWQMWRAKTRLLFMALLNCSANQESKDVQMTKTTRVRGEKRLKRKNNTRIEVGARVKGTDRPRKQWRRHRHVLKSRGC